MNNELLEAFREESNEILDRTEQLLMEAVEERAATVDVDELFRGIHTVKGNGSMFGLETLVTTAHRLESVFDRIRNGEAPLTSGIASRALEGMDLIRLLVRDPEAPLPEGSDELLSDFESFLGSDSVGGSDSPALAAEAVGAPDPGESEEEGGNLYLITFLPEPEIFENGSRPLAVIQRLRALGSYAGTCRLGEDVSSLDDLDPTTCLSSFWFIMHSRESKEELLDVFHFVAQEAKVAVDLVVPEIQGPSAEQWRQIREVLTGEPQTFLEEARKIVGRRESDAQETALEPSPQPREEGLQSASLRVKYESLQEMINQVGEILTLQARIENQVAETRQRDLQALLRRLSTNITELRDTAMQMRMVPLQSGLQHLRRLVHQSAEQVGKKVDFELDTGDTELDKVVVDSLKDPLVHLVRNAIDHGIESPQERLRAGKEETGTLRISSYHDRGVVVLRISDDGKGIDTERIRSKAMEKRLIGREEELSEKELQQLLFHPGFSTTSETTNLSGRGVGMDVVKKNIESLRGTVRLSSVPGEGTEVVLELPLTLAIVDGLLFRVRDTTCLVDLSIVDECLQLTSTNLDGGAKGRLLRLRDEAIPYLPMHALFVEAEGDGDAEAQRRGQQAIIAKTANGKLALLVDEILGQHQAAIKSLGAYMNEIDEFAGTTVLGDGTIAFVLDPQAVFRRSRELA